MNVTVKDLDLLQAIQPQQVATYLQHHGWHQQNQIADKASIWTRESPDGEQVQIVLPLHPDTPGFPVSMSLILETLEKIEKRSQLDIISDLITAVNDITLQGVVREVQTRQADRLSGKITLLGVVMEQLRSIETELDESDYLLALKAYQERLPIVCTGDLIKQQDSFLLKNPRHLTLAAPTQLPDSVDHKLICEDRV